METVIFWAFTIYCTGVCNERSPMTNKFMTKQSEAACIDQAKRLMALVGATGEWRIECRKHERTISTSH